MSGDLSKKISLLLKNEILPQPEKKIDGKRYRYRFDIRTKHEEEFRKNLTEFKIQNPDIDIFHEEISESILNKFVRVVSIRNLIFPIHATIRYVLGNTIVPNSFKEELQSYLKNEELPNANFIGDEQFKRFKIDLNVNDKESFERGFQSFKEIHPEIDIYVEFDKRTLKSYMNFIAYLIILFFGITRALGWDVILWLQNILKIP